MEKIVLRKQILGQRLGFNDTRRQAAKDKILAQLSLDKHFLNATYIGLYYPLPNEIELLDLITMYPNKIFGFPKVVNENIIYLQFDEHTVFKKAKFNVVEPSYGMDITGKLEVTLVPALGMTKTCYRLGYGKGYFDRFFKVYPNSYKIGIIYTHEIVEFEPSPRDVRLDAYMEG